MGNHQAPAELRGGLMPSLPAWLLLHFLLAAVLTIAARAYALHRQLLDQPGERRSHAIATPRGGGISIVLCVLLAAAWLGMADPTPGRAVFGYFSAGLVLVAGIGWWDDHRPLSPWIRLAVQALAGALLAWGIYRHGASPLLAVTAFVAVVALVNVWNFMDGIDGIATTQAVIAGAAYFWVLTGAWAALAAAFTAACLGFLPFNFPRARIFLGDVGSGALGYTLAGLLVASLQFSAAAWWLLALPLAVFLVDAGFTLAARMLAGDRWWSPHVSHVYQQAAFRWGHVLVTASYSILGLVTLMLILLLSDAPSGWMLASVSGYCLILLALWLGARKGLKMSGQGDSR
jgi:UDP-N-acetylmuramyl pentapeptide phosphotransferase/UDP-N-acetylglucosamine-1-phosphate transferase